MELTLIHLYPDLMNLYGSYANLSVLRRTLEGLGHSVTVQPVLPSESVALDGCHFLYLGAGTERAQKAALEALTPDHGPAGAGLGGPGPGQLPLPGDGEALRGGCLRRLPPLPGTHCGLSE